ncbi:MAG: cytochrome P450 [Proteobacteria bacterium]|nr:cytochrome P450 [Pseudomonadota bacterium]
MTSPATDTPLAEINPFDAAVLNEPFAFDRRLRAEAPVYRDPASGIVLVSTYERVMEVLRQPEQFSNRFAKAMGGGRSPDPEVQAVQAEGYPPVDTMLTADPPEHKRFRSLVNKAFTPRRVNSIEGEMEKISHELIDRFAADGRFEVLAQYSTWLPLTVIADQLGVPRSDLPKFKHWTDGFTAQLSGFADQEGEVEAAKRIVAFQHYFADRLEEAREAPRDDIISDLVRARIEGERPLDVPESLSIIQQLLVAGHETTAAAIAEGMRLLVENPEQMALVREDPSLIPNAVEEVVRLTTPTQNMWRVVVEDCELGGMEIPAKSLLLLRYGSANRDETVFPDPDRFDVRRENASENLAFGHGIHFCIGAMLARKEMLVAFRTLLGRLSGLRLAPGQKIHHHPSVLLRGLKSLELEFDPA